MGEFELWNDVSISESGINIPRQPGSGMTNQHIRHDMGLQMDDFSPHPQSHTIARPMTNHWNSGIDNHFPGSLHDNYQNSPQQFDFFDILSSPAANSVNTNETFLNQQMDMDQDIKVEPIDDADSFHGLSSTISSSFHDDLLFDINFDTFNNFDSIDSSHPTCLDPQHSSPAAMAAVRPSEIMGFGRGSSTPASSTPSTSTYSLNHPIKIENNTSIGLLGVPSSYPPLDDFKDPFLNSSSSVPSHNSHMIHQSVSNQNVDIFMNDVKPTEIININQNTIKMQPQSPYSPMQQQQQSMQQQIIQPHHQNPQQMQFNSLNNETSTLQKLLLRSPEPPISSPLSPESIPSPLSIHSHHEDQFGQSVPRTSPFTSGGTMTTARLSSSAPAHTFMEAWQRREPRQHLLSTGSLAEEFGGSASSLSTSMFSVGNDISLDDTVDSDVDSDNENFDSDSDNESIKSEDPGNCGSKRDRSFWQYNVQAKGPKGQRVNIAYNVLDPHVLPQPADPVFSNMCTIQGIKHSGKARRGDGNDLTPSPRKLVSIGKELDKLNKQINDMAPVSELPFQVRPKCRKEKNKLASRACRLKKKAQHEANKIKLYGLEQEHKGLLNLLFEIRKVLIHKLELNAKSGGPPSTSQFHGGGMMVAMATSPSNQSYGSIFMQLEAMVKNSCKTKIAGHTTEFVNRVIEMCRSGKSNGGLEELASSFDRTNITSPSPSEDPSTSYDM